MPIIPLVIGAALSFFGLQLDWYYAFNPEQGPSFGAFGDPFISIQLAENPSNGDCLFSDGTNNYWDAGCSGGSGSSFSTTSANWWASLGLAFSTTSADYWETQQAARGGSGGSGNVATSTTESAGALAYWTSSGATPATLGNVATTTLTASSPLSLSNTVWKVGGSNSVLTLDTSGTWTGNAGTATALAANGSNCTAGSYALGVDASGNAEGCTDATTEINSAISTHASNAEAHQALVTLAGTPDYLTLSGQQITRGLIDLTTDVTGTLPVGNGGTGATSLNNLITLGTHTTGNYLATLSSSGSITVGNSGSETAAVTVNLNLGNANTWTALQTFANSSTTLASFSYASSTKWFGGGLDTDCDTAATSKLLWDITTGRFSCGTDQTAAGAADPFIWASNYAAINAATSSILWAQSGLNASSTSHFVNASSTLFSTDYGSTTDAVIGRTLTLFGTAYTTLAALGNALVNAVTAVTPTGTWDFGGATSIEIVNGTNPTVDAIGEIAIDTTANELLYATSTTATSPAVIKPYRAISFSYASSTQGSGTTTRSLGVAPAAGYLDEIQCDFSNFMRVMIYDGTNRLNDLVASSTVGTVKFTTNNAFTAGEPIRVDLGTTTNIAANVYGGCTAKFYYTRN